MQVSLVAAVISPLDATLREIQSFHPMHPAGAHGIKQLPMECSKCAIAYLLRRVQAAEETLRQIETRRTPCRKCGRPHEWRPGVPEGFVGTWADPIDGHEYEAENPQILAQKYLATTWQEAQDAR